MKPSSKIKTGLWRSAGKNPFWINLVADKVFWLGMNNSSDSISLGENWCHVGYGKLVDNQIILDWADIPAGQDELFGQIKIQIISDTEMEVIEDSGNFGKSTWTWESAGLNFSKV